VQIGNAQSLGTGSWQLFNGELVATRDITMAVPGSVTAASTLAAAHDKVLTLDNLSFDSTSAVTIGDVGNDGAVVVEGGFAGPVSVDVRFGALRAGDGSALTDMLGSADTSTTVEAGAMIAWAGFGGTIGNLFGAGTVTNADGATITLLAGDFAGVIAGNSVLQIDGGVILSGASTYTGGTFVDSGGALALGNGGTTGSVVGSIVDNGVLIIDHSNAFAETAAISGAGSLIQRGAGTTTIDRAESYSGGTTVAAGELSIDRAAAIGSGPLDLAGGELLVTKSAALTNSLSVAGDATIAAATGSALSLSFSDWSFDAHSITFGDDNNAGTIVWHTPAGGDGVASGDQFTVDIHAGTLKAGDANLSELLFPAQNTTIDAGATLNVGAVGTAIGNLLGSGKLVGSGGTTLQIRNGDFAGQINGDIATVEVAGALRVSGSNTFTGQYELAGGSSLTLAHAATQDVAFFGDATLVFTLGNAYGGTVSNFDLKVGQTMDFAGLAFAQASEHFHNGVLTMTDGTHTERVHLAGTFSDASFALSDDHHGGTDVNFTGTTDSAYFGLG
jgi:autotransporter-associated beta strand protein